MGTTTDTDGTNTGGETEYHAIETPEAVTTEPQSRPEPTTDPPAVELDEIPADQDRVVCFSGGNDSLAMTHYAMSHGLAEWVLYLDTNSGLAQNLDFVRAVCEKYGWPLVVEQSPMSLAKFGKRYGFPAAEGHSWAYNYFKGRQLRRVARAVDGDVKLFSGVREDESNRRMKTITGEVQRATDFEGWWIAPIHDWTDQEVYDYIEEQDLPQNPVVQNIHRSGDCYCMAYGHRDEVLVDLESVPEYEAHAEWLLNVEKRVQEYRGRLAMLRDEDPDVYDELNTIREQFSTYPSRMQIAKAEYPEKYEWMVAHSAEDAINRAQQEESNFLGRQGMSSKELRALMAANDQYQMPLCQNCSSEY